MALCSFCKKNYEPPRGTTVVQKDSSVRYYCSSKCRKNSEMGRLNKKVRWVRKSDIVKKDLAKKEASYLLRRRVEEEKKEKTKPNNVKKK
jgi:large subunit ribosomal protein L24e|tara:strand:- start:2112 stop:2381 length:270 start_codon:yes stop_codon:yes gene_type:complete